MRIEVESATPMVYTEPVPEKRRKPKTPTSTLESIDEVGDGARVIVRKKFHKKAQQEIRAGVARVRAEVEKAYGIKNKKGFKSKHSIREQRLKKIRTKKDGIGKDLSTTTITLSSSNDTDSDYYL